MAAGCFQQHKQIVQDITVGSFAAYHSVRTIFLSAMQHDINTQPLTHLLQPLLHRRMPPCVCWGVGSPPQQHDWTDGSDCQWRGEPDRNTAQHSTAQHRDSMDTQDQL